MKIVKKQRNSKMCVICGMDNKWGVHAQFYNTDDGAVVSPFRFSEHHQSYPGRVHGGMITAMLDEIGLRAIWPVEPDVWGVTMSLETKYRKPVPYNEDLYAFGKITSSTHRFMQSRACICDSYGNRLADATLKYIKLDPSQITDKDFHEEMCYYIEDNVTEIPVNISL